MCDYAKSQEFDQDLGQIDVRGISILKISSNSLSGAIHQLEFSWLARDTTFHLL